MSFSQRHDVFPKNSNQDPITIGAAHMEEYMILFDCTDERKLISGGIHSAKNNKNLSKTRQKWTIFSIILTPKL